MVFAIALAIFVILLSIWLSIRRPSNVPPGPWGLPIVGHLPLLGDNPAKKLLKWKETYGPTIFVRFGSINTVVFNDIKTVKEAFAAPTLNARKPISYFPEATQGKGIAFGSGNSVNEQRKFVLREMKDRMNNDLEDVMLTEINELLKQFKLKSGQPMRIHRAFNLSTVNSIWMTLMGKRFEHGDKNLDTFAATCTRLLELPAGFQLFALYMPWLTKLMPNRSGYNSGLEEHKQLIDFIREQIEELKPTRQKDNPRHLVDAYLDKVEETTDENSSFFSAKNMQPNTISDLFLGGIDTTSTLLEWALTYLAVYPDVQRKLQKEISDVTGDTRAACLDDRPSMPYTEAIINEIIRKAPLINFNFGKVATVDTPFQGYTIPKGTMLFGNFYALFQDKEVWGDPENFRPERFIDENGAFTKPESMITFGWGKRSCVGEYLARKQSFLYMTAIFQKFNVTPAPGKELNLLERFSIIVHPVDTNEVVLTER